jgi:ketosteroid isomerase-like protein
MVEPLQANDHEAVAREFFAAAEAADLDRVIAMMHPDIVWEVPGRSPVAGCFVGRDAAVAMLVRIAEMAGGPPQAKMREITYVREHWFETRGFDELTAWTKGGPGPTP